MLLLKVKAPISVASNITTFGFCLNTIRRPNIHKFSITCLRLPSSKRLHNYGKSPFFEWVSQRTKWQFSIAMLVYRGYWGVMWVKQCHKPPMTGNGKHTTYTNGDLGDGLLLFYPHYWGVCAFLMHNHVLTDFRSHSSIPDPYDLTIIAAQRKGGSNHWWPSYDRLWVTKAISLCSIYMLLKCTNFQTPIY